MKIFVRTQWIYEKRNIEQNIRISQAKYICVLKLQKHRCSGAVRQTFFPALCCVVI